jgi:hypothetical protein
MKLYIAVAIVTLALIIFSCESKGEGSSNLPSDPRSEGKKTLEGIDSNNDGVRDDLEIAIYEYASKPEEESLRRAMRQNAKAKQLAIIAGYTKDPQKVKEAENAMARSVACAVREMSDKYKNWNFFTYMEGKATNTPERVEAYMRYNQALSGKVYSLPKDPNPCD